MHMKSDISMFAMFLGKTDFITGSKLYYVSATMHKHSVIALESTVRWSVYTKCKATKRFR